MAYDDVTAAYVDVLTYGKYSDQTTNTSAFDTIKSIYSVYLNPDTLYVPTKKYTHGLALLVAHHYAMNDIKKPAEGASGSDITKGSITSESVGDISISYGGGLPSMGNVQGWKSWLMQTRYGQEFVYLMKTFKGLPIVTGSSC